MHSLNMSMMENRDKFFMDYYHEKEEKKQTNYNKLAKCLAKICEQCCRCCVRKPYILNTGTEDRDRDREDDVRSNERLMSDKRLDVDIPFKHSRSHRNVSSETSAEHIEDSRLIKRRKLYNDNAFDAENTENEFLRFHMETEANPSFEKLKKVKVENLCVNVEEQSILMSVVNFITYPFNVRNTTIKQNRTYNRFPPSSMEIELENIRLVIGNGMTDYYYNSIEVLIGLKFVMEDEGDVTYGPGEQKWDANACVNVNYCKGNSENKYIPISLCRDTSLVYTKDIKIPFYKNMDQTYEKKEHFYMTGKDDQIHFKFPLTELKFIRKLFKKVNESNLE